MLLKTLKSNQAHLFFLVPLIAVVLWIKSFVHSEAYTFFPAEDQMILYKPIGYLLGENLLLNNVFALIFTILLSFLILKLNVQYAFIKARTFLPPSLFILITSGMPHLHSMHPVYPAALFLILTIDRIFNSYDKESIHSNAFEAGLLLSIGSLFYLNLIFFFPILWFGFIILKPKVNWREYILSTIGFSFPWLAAITFYLGTGSQDELWQTVQMNIVTHNIFLKDNLPLQIYLGYLVLLILFGSFYLLSQYADKRISSRKFFKVFFWIFVISVILIAANPAISQEIIVILAIPLTYLISNYFIFMKRQFWGEVLLYILTAGIIYLQFT